MDRDAGPIRRDPGSFLVLFGRSFGRSDLLAVLSRGTKKIVLVVVFRVRVRDDDGIVDIGLLLPHAFWGFQEKLDVAVGAFLECRVE